MCAKRNDNADKRTVENCDMLYERSSASSKPGGAEFKNVIRRQLLNLGPENTVPTPLHIMLGEGNYIIGMILKLCQAADVQAAADGNGPDVADVISVSARKVQDRIDEIRLKQKNELPQLLAEIKAEIKQDKLKYKKINDQIALEKPLRLNKRERKHWDNLK